jgi:FkbM family methyltransferase
MNNKYTVSYSQNREDIIIASFFLNKKDGFYIDVGANEPYEDSVTKYFYDLGWNGINIEPSPWLYKKMVEARERDINLNIGISNKKGTLDFREYEGHGLSTFSKDRKNELEKENNNLVSNYRDYTVDVITLKEIFEKYVKDKKVDFLKIDVEGYEYNVIEGNDWKKYRPVVLCIEANHINRNWQSILIDNNYRLVYNDGLNDYYVDENEKDITFDYLNSAVGRHIISRYAAKDIARLNNAEKERDTALAQCQRMELENQMSKEKMMPLVFENQELRAKLNENTRLRKQVVQLLRTIDSILLVHINKLDYQIAIVDQKKEVLKSKQSFEQLRLSAKKEDINKYYNLSSGIAVKHKKMYLIVLAVYNQSKKIVKKLLLGILFGLKKLKGVIR